MIEIKVPSVGESISEVTLLKWLKKDGEYVDRDEVIAELESEKATFEVNAEQAGALKTVAKEGDTLHVGSVLAHIDETAEKPAASGEEVRAKEPAAVVVQEASSKIQEAGTRPQETSTKKEEVKPGVAVQQPPTTAPVTSVSNNLKATPVASAIIADKKVDPSSIKPSGPSGKILKHDVLEALQHPGKKAFDGSAAFYTQ